VISPTLFLTFGLLRFIELKEFSSDTQTLSGPSIIGTAIHLNLNECLLPSYGVNGGCVQRDCLDQLSAAPVCGACYNGYEPGIAFHSFFISSSLLLVLFLLRLCLVNSTHCQKVDPCNTTTPCGSNADCFTGPLPDRNKTCTCWRGYVNTTGTCTVLTHTHTHTHTHTYLHSTTNIPYVQPPTKIHTREKRGGARHIGLGNTSTTYA